MRPVMPLDQIALDMPDRLDALLRWVEEIEVLPEEIPLWLRISDHPLELQKLAVLMQSPKVLNPDPGVAPEPFDPRWVQVLVNLCRTKPDATFVEIADEYNRLALEDSAAHPAPEPKN